MEWKLLCTVRKKVYKFCISKQKGGKKPLKTSFLLPSSPECVCNKLGTDNTKGACDASTGQCPCLPNVSGLECDRCTPGFYNLASGKGCQECNCDKEGSLEGSCNQVNIISVTITMEFLLNGHHWCKNFCSS